MQEALTIGMLGGDLRQITVTRALKKKGYRIKSMGLFEGITNWKSMIEESDVVVTGLPMTQDGMHLHAPLYEGEKVHIGALLESLGEKPLLCGRIPKEWADRASERKVPCYDYFIGETLQVQNALPSAEGAIFLAMQELPVVLSGTKIAITGYGRIGKLLAHKLRALDADVTVYVRRGEVVAEAMGNGLHARLMTDETLSDLGEDCRILFNTVPYCIFGRESLSLFPKECVYIELASFPGGVDPIAAREAGIRMRPGGGLPGKYAPETAGHYLANAIDALIKQTIMR